MFGSFPPSPLVVSASKVYSGLGADIVYGIITVIDLGGMSAMACSQYAVKRNSNDEFVRWLKTYNSQELHKEHEKR